MLSLMSLTSPGIQPQTNSTPFNSLFTLIYILIGGILILALFISIVIGNLERGEGGGLTERQRGWRGMKRELGRWQIGGGGGAGRGVRGFKGWCLR